MRKFLRERRRKAAGDSIERGSGQERQRMSALEDLPGELVDSISVHGNRLRNVFELAEGMQPRVLCHLSLVVVVDCHGQEKVLDLLSTRPGCKMEAVAKNLKRSVDCMHEELKFDRSGNA